MVVPKNNLENTYVHILPGVGSDNNFENISSKNIFENHCSRNIFENLFSEDLSENTFRIIKVSQFTKCHWFSLKKS